MAVIRTLYPIFEALKVVGSSKLRLLTWEMCIIQPKGLEVLSNFYLVSSCERLSFSDGFWTSPLPKGRWMQERWVVSWTANITCRVVNRSKATPSNSEIADEVGKKCRKSRVLLHRKPWQAIILRTSIKVTFGCRSEVKARGLGHSNSINSITPSGL